MQWLADYWWIILIVLVGILINGVKALYKVNYDPSMKTNSKLPPHRDNNAAWDAEDDEQWRRNDKTPKN